MNVLKIKGIKYLNVEIRLLFYPQSKVLATRLSDIKDGLCNSKFENFMV